MIKAITPILIAITFLGCASNPPVKINYTDVSIPELNTETTAYLGERMLSQGKGYYAKSITLSSLDAFAADIQGGVFYNIPGTNKYQSKDPNTVTVNNGYGNPLRYQDWFNYYEKSNEVCPSTGLCYDDGDLTIEKNDSETFVVKENTFQQVIEYNGKSGQTLKFTYREFGNQVARQAFTTNFTMDLNEGDTVGYKGARLKVIEANNNRIKFILLSNFNL